MFYVAGRIKWGTWGISLPPSLLVSGASLFAMAGFLSQCWVSYAVDFLFFFARDCIFIYMQFWDHLPFTDVLLILDRQTRATLFQNYLSGVDLERDGFLLPVKGLSFTLLRICHRVPQIVSNLVYFYLWFRSFYSQCICFFFVQCGQL